MQTEYEVDGQLSIFDLDFGVGKTCQAPYRAQGGQTSEQSSKKQSGLSSQKCMYLSLKNGAKTGLWTEITGNLPGESWMLNTTESLRDVEDCTLSSILLDTVPEILFERESVSWNFAEIAETWQRTSLSLEDRIGIASRIISGELRTDSGTLEVAESGTDSGNDSEVFGMNEPVCFDGSNVTNPINASNPKPGDPCHTLSRDSRNYVVEKN